MPAAQTTVPVPVVTTALGSRALQLTLAHAGQGQIVYTLSPNDYGGSPATVTVNPGGTKTVSWPGNRDGYYDVVVTASTADGFRRRYAGRIA